MGTYICKWYLGQGFPRSPKYIKNSHDSTPGSQAKKFLKQGIVSIDCRPAWLGVLIRVVHCRIESDTAVTAKPLPHYHDLCYPLLCSCCHLCHLCCHHLRTSCMIRLQTSMSKHIPKFCGVLGHSYGVSEWQWKLLPCTAWPLRRQVNCRNSLLLHQEAAIRVVNLDTSVELKSAEHFTRVQTWIG